MALLRVKWLAAIVLMASIGFLSKGLTGANGENSVSSRNKIEWVEAEQIDGDNLASVEGWARGICRGVTVEEAAEDLQVEPSLTAVIDALTRSLPASTRERAAEICRAGLSK